jgi:mannose-6-phosphate isomerase-like protein (cupin superfamily)
VIKRQVQDIPWEGVSHNPEIRKKVLIARGIIPHLNAFSQSIIAPGQKVTPHTHKDMAEIFLIQQGKGTIQVNGRELPLTQGTCIAVQPGEEHSLWNTGSDDLQITYICIETGKDLCKSKE